MASELYRRQVGLLVQCLPFISDEVCFALKGGTAINLFIRDLPRLSVDIDLTYLPVKDRSESLADIDAAMKRIAQRLSAGIPDLRVQEVTMKDEDSITRLQVRRGGAQAKIEVSPVIRGCVFDASMRRVSPVVERQYGFAESQIVSFADLFAGKIVAALDRQHPRDLFDVRELLANEGITGEIREAFIVYLISHNRPMFEVLEPNLRDIEQEYERGFRGMTEIPVTLDELLEARTTLISSVVSEMPQSHRDFLVSFESGQPDWELLSVRDVESLPAVQWRIENLTRIENARRNQLVKNLERVLRDA